MSQPLPSIQNPTTPKVAFDPLDPQWQAPRPRGASSGAIKVAPPALSSEALEKREKAGVQVMAARLAFAREDMSEARTRLREAFGIDSTDASALELLGDIFLSEAEQQKAIEVFERGRKYHPQNKAFEEKIALALLDLAEMERDREQARLLIEEGDKGNWQDRKPGLAAMLSLLVPGMGQIYNEDEESGYILFGAALGCFLAWNFILNRAQAALSGATAPVALAQMNAFAKFGFWIFLLAGCGIAIYAAHDAYRGAERANRGRRHLFGV